MRKCLLAALLAVCTMIASGAAAQHRNRPAGMNPDGNRPSAEEIAQMRSARMTEALGLDENQARTVYDQCLRVAQLQRQLAEARQENAANMKQILNEEQYAKWEKMRKSRRDRMRHRMGPKEGCGPDGVPCCDNPGPAKKKIRRAERSMNSQR